MLEFQTLRVAHRAAAARDAVALDLQVPAELAERYRFAAGQHVTVRARIDGLEERRCYSLVGPEGSGTLRLGVRVQAGGRMSPYLAGLAEGDAVEVMAPTGAFRLGPEPAWPRSCVAFAAGSGITPVLSVAATVLEREARSRFRLYYGNTGIARTMFVEELMALKNRFLDRFSVGFVMSREPQEIELFNGRLDAAKVRELARRDFDPLSIDEAFVCGPGGMVEEIRRALQELGCEAAVHVEHYVPTPGAPAPSGVAADVAGEVAVTVIAGGRRRQLTMARDGESLLEAARRAGLDPPFSCRSGICSTCRVKLLRGRVEMANNLALEPWEVAAGYVLCCQARPRSDVIEISYDH